MALNSLTKKLFRALTRVIPQCNMISQAVAFNMFLAFFPLLIIAMGLLSSSLQGKNGPDLVAQLAAILPPGSWQLVSELLLRHQMNTFPWVFLGWGGTLLVGSQVMKLIMEGIHLIYGDPERPSFFGRQFRGMLLFCVTIVAWLGAVVLSVFSYPLFHWLTPGWLTPGFGQSPWVRGFWNIMLPVGGLILEMVVLAVIYRFARLNATSWRSVFPGAGAATILWWGLTVLFGIYVRKMQFGLVYGTLAAVIGLMVWMEFSAMIVFFGAAWNAEGAPPASRL
ncbi:MAG TPA: YihY/virulence factor BrkB family protein [Candidatus Angelobacter sp.]|nr:YihY/virulence factor BrkB family protein [Candidatus Angelobacter sp.]